MLQASSSVSIVNLQDGCSDCQRPETEEVAHCERFLCIQWGFGGLKDGKELVCVTAPIPPCTKVQSGGASRRALPPSATTRLDLAITCSCFDLGGIVMPWPFLNEILCC
mmetsp:Transcript_8595/g.12605  ORF Transcript_8595/g.12605 Transcript_8595/m.12605 type:complete len:109 (-) Transcript_8595:23-349(-)